VRHSVVAHDVNGHMGKVMYDTVKYLQIWIWIL